MKCCQCDKPAMFGYPSDSGPPIPLCLDCSIKYDALMEAQLERVQRMYNHQVAQMEAAVGMSGFAPRFPARPPRAVVSGPTTLHNIHISGGIVGVVNSGSIGRIDSAVGSLAKGGDAEAAEAIKNVTEAVASSELSDADKKKVLDSLSLVAAEATAPKESRRSGAMLAVIKDVGEVFTVANTLHDVWVKFSPFLVALFS